MRRKAIHLVGIGGVGMSGLAGLLLARGARVSGSDARSGPVLERLRRRGARVLRGHSPRNVPPDAGLLIHSAAIGPDNPERLEAERRRIRVASFGEALGWMLRLCDGIAVAGTHGKTTTTAMIGHVLVEAGRDPAVLLGGSAPNIGGNFRLGRGPAMVVEACEYRRSFLELRPRVAVLTNVEEDHLDCYGDIEDIRSAFREFATRVAPEGALALNARLLDPLAPLPRRRRLTFSADETAADVRAVDPRWVSGRLRFGVTCGGTSLGEAALRVAGQHNAWNAAAAVAACILHGVDGKAAVAALSTFDGVQRRFQVKGAPCGVTVIDDYAHHPTAIRAVLETARTSYPGRRIVAVFQPHQHSRTRSLLADFASSFGFAERVVVPDIYAARDTDEDRRSVSSRDLVERIRAHGVHAEYVPSLPRVLSYLLADLRAGDVCLTLGAGNVTGVSDDLVRRLEKTSRAV
jgi:UDP-N-acetylmuramate--alanine ligase